MSGKVRTLIENQTVITVEPDSSVRDAVRLMAENDIGAVAVGSGDTLAGIFTERDLMVRVIDAELDPATTPVSKVMTTNVVAIGPDDNFEDCVITMKLKGFRHMPVLDGDRLIGMLSFRDLLQADLERIRDRADVLARLVRLDPIYDA